MAAMRKFRGSSVVINVYDLTPANGYTYDFGVGAFHSGVVISGTEYAFGAHEGSSSGVFTHSPMQAPGAQFRTSIDMGETEMSHQDVQREIAALGEHFRGNAYHLILCNCNHFAAELCLRLTGKRMPGWVNRLAYMGSWVSCLLPKGMGVAHPESSDVQSQSTLAAYKNSGVANFRSFSGQGMSLSAPGQESMSHNTSAKLSEKSESERRALLAEAAMKRFGGNG
uniref:PPPDE domain-containing protein n=1 Tax=Hemiselmis andersenii TaxID=464988 RepID=A0A6T8MXS7_HEMAN|mmetsp:Transcript_6988/g.15969  ORF Transcript_6988/g.15969 Transcript_6988/m.15969 type:complete len:225 (-) Transcript_6988:806-1480(-)